MLATSAALAFSMATLPQVPNNIDPDKIWNSPDVHRACLDTLKGMEHPYFKRVASAVESDGYTFKIPTATDKPTFTITPTVYAVTNTPTKTVWLIKDNIGSSKEILFEVFANEGAHIIVKPSTYPSFSEEGSKNFLDAFKKGERKDDFSQIMRTISHETASFLPGHLITQESRGTPVTNITDLAPTVDTFFRRATYQVLSRVFPKPVFDKLNSVPPADSAEGYFFGKMVEYVNSGNTKKDILGDLKTLGFEIRSDHCHALIPVVSSYYDSSIQLNDWSRSSFRYAANDSNVSNARSGYYFLGIR